MKKLILFIIIILLNIVPFAFAAEYTCGTNGNNNSCTPAGLDTLIGNASAGDTIHIATGTHAWTTTVTVDKRVTISGGGSCTDCGETATPSGNWPTELQPSGNQSFLIKGPDNADENIIRITGLKISDTTGYSYNWFNDATGCIIHVSLTNYANFRIDNNYTIAEDSAVSYGAMHIVLHGSYVYGVIDSNYMVNENEDGGIFMVHETAEGDGDGDQAFLKAPQWGTDQFMYIESNTIDYQCGNAGQPWGPGSVDGFAGARFVFRYNYSRNNFVLFHDHSGGGYVRAGHAAEVYENTFEWYETGDCADNFGGAAVLMRAGLWLVHDNDFVGDGWNTIIQMTIGRAAGSQGSWGSCDNANDWDGDASSPDGYPCLDQPGWAQSSGVTPSTIQPQTLEPVRIWSNTKDPAETWMRNVFPTYIVEDTDYYFSTDDTAAKGGYTPYTYPHPLRGEAVTPSAISIPGNLSISSGSVNIN